jgi:adenylosuccinate synthase
MLPDFDKKYQALRAKHLGLVRLHPEIEFDLEIEEAAWMASLELLRSLQHVNGDYLVNEFLREGKRILAEGAQGSMLDIDFGTYPYVTSSNTITAGACSGLGIAPDKIGEVIGVSKAYCTRVGGGPFPTELDDETGEALRREGAEFGATTGRPRRCGWIDLPQLRYSIMLNGVTQLVITKIDVLNQFQSIKAATAYRYNGVVSDQLPYDLCEIQVEPVWETFHGWNQSLEEASSFEEMPAAARKYVEALEQSLGVPVTMVSTGPERKQLILKR